MNTDQVKGTLKDAAGKAQEKFGELIDSPTRSQGYCQAGRRHRSEESW